MGSSEDESNVRERLLRAATEVFARKGYKDASTREICRMADANGAAIHYYFGDKASLYREVFRPPERLTRLPPELTDPKASLRAGLEAFFRQVLRPLTEPGVSPHLRLLVIREEVQPSGVLTARHSERFRPNHEALCRFLARHCGVEAADLAIEHLAFSLAGMAVMLLIRREAVDTLAPDLLRDPQAVEDAVQRLTQYGVALVKSERRRRQSPGGGKRGKGA
ncbi:MAG TPA: CerR family C-terminal domain-containing protein [Gammaproteobacteria bacterium]|nr:CerR family C-terminal domain-containing protein [Gammaproteobacteria bacterium]